MKPVSQVKAVAKITFQELIREKFFWISFVFTFFLVVLSMALSQLSFAEPHRYSLDFGTAGISLVGSLLSIILGSSLLHKEMKERTLYLALTKSIWRWQFVFGKISGLFASVTLNVLIMYLVVHLSYFLWGGNFHFVLIQGIVTQLCEFLILCSLSLFFSTFTTSTLASVYTASFWLIGHAILDVQLTFQKWEPSAFKSMIIVLLKILPQFNLFNLRSEISHGIAVPMGYFLMTIGYGIALSSFFFLATCVLFSRRDL